MGVLRGMWKIMRVQEWQGDVKQQGGAFIIGPGKFRNLFVRIVTPKPI
jgi:hypothetical protein